MARKRGGLAGIYDRNKKLIKTVAPIAAGFIPVVGPAIGAGIGAAIGGDREGKGYFKGFNTGGALMGGVSGYGGAKLGQAAKGKLSGMFTGQNALGKLTGAPKLGVMTQTTGPAQAAFSTASNVASNAGAGGTPGFGLDSLGKLFGKEGFIEQNKTVLSGLGKGVMAERAGSREDEQARLQMEENARMFDEQQKLRVRQQGNLDQTAMMDKQQFDELNANRARLRAILTGGM